MRGIHDSIDVTRHGLFQFCSNTIMSTTHREITVAGYTYKEYRGCGIAPDSLRPPPIPGDIYLDIANPYRVFVCHSNGWIEWVSMARTAEVAHPTMNKIILPTYQRFSWVASSSIRSHTAALQSRLGGRPDSAQTHVAIILDGEAQANTIPQPILKSKPIAEPINQDADSSLSDLSSISHGDANPVQTPPRRSSDSRMSVDGPPAVPFKDRCANMRIANAHIRGLIASSPSTSHNPS